MPMPVGGAILQSTESFTLPYSKYLKAIGDDLLTANKVIDTSTNGFKYVINANVCFFTYYVAAASITDITVQLPYKALLAFDVLGTVYAPSTKVITIPAKTTYVHGWYICDFNVA